MKGLRKILRVERTAKKTNEWVLNKAELNRELLDTVKARNKTNQNYVMTVLAKIPQTNNRNTYTHVSFD